MCQLLYLHHMLHPQRMNRIKRSFVTLRELSGYKVILNGEARPRRWISTGCCLVSKKDLGGVPVFDARDMNSLRRSPTIWKPELVAQSVVHGT